MPNPKQLAVLRMVLLIALAFRSGAGNALGLGPMRLQSALGQPLHASVQVLGPEARILADTCIRSRLLAPDGSELLRPDVELRRRNGQTEITLGSQAVVEEPAVTLAIEVTCAPEMHREYQLLLDLRDGLPRVLATDNMAAATARQAIPQRTAEAGDAGAERRARRRVVFPAPGHAGRAAEAMTVAADADLPVTKRRAKGLPGARNVLKLSQSDLDVGRKPVPGLRLSDSLSNPPGSAAARESDDVRAAKARFAAMLRNEDPVEAAQRQIRSLEVQLQRPLPGIAVGTAGAAALGTSGTSGASGAPGAPGTSKAPATTASVAVSGANSHPATAALPASTAGAATPAAASAPVARPRPAPAAPAGASSLLAEPPRRFGGASFWLLGLGALLLAAIGVLSVVFTGSRRNAGKTASPWWAGSGDSTDREARLLESARSFSAARTPPEGTQELDRLLAEDRLLHRYVSQFTTTEPPTDAQTGRRVAPSGLRSLVHDTGATDVALTSEDRRAPQANALQHDDPRASRLNAGETFELVSDVMQEAEFWKMLNETQRAIDILETYCNADVASSPVPWLYLADLYLGSGEMEKLGALRETFRLRFNGRMTSGDAETGAGAGTGTDVGHDASAGSGERHAADPRRSLEDYPHVMRQISQLWGHHEVVPFLQNLLLNQRDAPRQGFNLSVYREILLLIDVAREREQEFA